MKSIPQIKAKKMMSLCNLLRLLKKKLIKIINFLVSNRMKSNLVKYLKKEKKIKPLKDLKLKYTMITMNLDKKLIIKKFLLFINKVRKMK